ncbi:MAG TPA: EF-P beta-lysylation protein EpmB [Gammaproteobacteria bacterium]|nr:EF-P beta-lysylation protein EpmB [Gammaproteobacteria bacterium]
MIPLTVPRPRWQHELQQAITDPAELLALLELDAAALPPLRATTDFPLRVPRGFVARMRKRDPADPLLRQVLPLAVEDAPAPGFVADPVGDLASAAGPGLLHKYHGRVLLVATGACAVHCRYCFRRHFPYADENPRPEEWRDALDYIRADASIAEVILSGGDPLSLSDRRLAALAHVIASIPHVRRLRIHTRQPVVLPERIDAAFLGWFAPLRLEKVVVVHANHANEINAQVAEAFAALKDAGAALFNQSVLLAGVNDSVAALADLSEALFAAGAIPYYLHLLDRVAGAAHFEVPETHALTLHAKLRARLAGYLVPRLVREEPGKDSKTPVAEVAAEIH